MMNTNKFSPCSIPWLKKPPLFAAKAKGRGINQVSDLRYSSLLPSSVFPLPSDSSAAKRFHLPSEPGAA
jgi:hypothetical protein